MGRVTPDGFAFEGPRAPTKHFKGIGVDVWQWWPNTMTTNFNLIGKE